MGEAKNLQVISVQFNCNFSIFGLGPTAAYCNEKNIGFQLPMCQCVPKFALETKNVPYIRQALRSSIDLTSNMAEIRGLSALAKPPHIEQNMNNKCA